MSFVSYVEKYSTELRDLSLKLHQNPEISSKEVYAHELLTDYLESKGFLVQRHFCLETGFLAETQVSGPVISFFSEYDALPGLGHACGHNLIAILGIASALGLRDVLQDKGIQAKIKLFGSPAEETFGGKINLIETREFQDVQLSLMAHPGHIDAIYGKWLAMAALEVEFFGKSAHASAAPWEGINALDAAISSYNSISTLRQQSLPTNRIHGVIHNGGTRPNIIPDYSKMEYYVRSETLEDCQDLVQKVKNCFQGAALATGCTFKITEQPVFSNVVDHEKLLRSYEHHAKQNGITFEDEFITKQQSRGSTDMGNVTRKVPGIHPLFKIGNAVYHTPEFALQAKTTQAHEKTLKVAASLIGVAIDFINTLA